MSRMRDLSSIKICFLAGTLGQGGAERQLFYLLQALRNAGAAPRVLCLTRNEFWESKIQNLGVPVTWVGRNRSPGMRLGRIVAALRKDPPRILQSQHFFTNAFAAAAARLLGAREIGAMRNDGISEVRSCGSWRGWMNLRAPRILAANSRPAIDYARSRGLPLERLFYLPNVVDTERLSSPEEPSFRSRRDADRKQTRLILVARLVEQKRVDRFLELVARVRANPDLEGREVNALIVGAGPLRNELMEQARRLGLGPPVVEFRGTTADVAPLYRESDICVLTSDHEGTPNVLLEAMAAGLPVVATNVGGVPDLIRDGETGFLCHPGNSKGMARALASLILDSGMRARMGTAAQRFVTAHRTLSSLPEFLRELYDKTLTGRRIDHAPRRSASISPSMRAS